MPSHFPGMDPFIEQQECDDFHARFSLAISDALSPGIKPRYFVRVERRVYAEHPPEWEADKALRVGDVALIATERDGSAPLRATSAAAVAEPVVCTLPMAADQSAAPRG
jgi:hypothetical protein